MNKIKLIAMDLDGTLFAADHHTVSKRNADALMKARQNGINTVIATGRTYCQIQDVLRQTNGMSYILVSNGAAALDGDGKSVFSNCMDYDKWLEAYKILSGYNIVTEVYHNGNTYLTEPDYQFYTNALLPQQLLDDLKAAITFCDDVPDTLYEKQAEKLTSLYVPKELDAMLRQKFEAMGLSVTSSIPMNMEITQNGVNKATGLKGLCDQLGITPDEVLAFGDGENDVEMLQWAENSYAMSNACDKAKSAAKYMTKSNDEDGVALVIEKILEE
jgi:hypothetical protein